MLVTDTIDLQDHDAPSAQSHPHRPNPLQINPTNSIVTTDTFAPHQAETLREVAEETREEELKSPRISWANGGVQSGDLHQHAQNLAAGVTSAFGQASAHDKMAANTQQDSLAVAQNGGLVSQDNTDEADMDGEESDLDDDMMDKISSSPSIDDGGSSHQLPSFESSQPDASPGSSPVFPCFSEARSSSPYLDLPVYLPLQCATQLKTSRSSVESRIPHHHLPGAFPEDLDDQASDAETVPGASSAADQDVQETRSLDHEAGRAGLIYQEATAPNTSADAMVEDLVHEQQSKRKALPELDEAVSDVEYDSDGDGGLILSYEGSTDDDDELFFQSINSDPRFIDSGWGGECLHDTEDIDFELVYALHTFIATVEGQANATKGDAMVLLDDSNSYWWLVRVVKDSSIGKSVLAVFHWNSWETHDSRVLAGRAHRNSNGTTC